MSRIYDALQRANLERKSSRDVNPAERAELFNASGIADQPPAREAIDLENIALYPWNPSISSLPTVGDRGEGIEQFRGLRSQFYEFRDQGPLKTILVSSGMPSEGKTFVAANLAMSLARNQNNNILIIDADLRRPGLNRILGAPNTPGLTEYLSGSADAQEILQRNKNLRVVESGIMRSIPNLTYIPAGNGGDNSSELIDSPPVLAFADAIDLARAADAVLLVIRAATTPFDVAQRAQAAFGNSRILGFVLNAVKNAPRNSSYYYGYHHYGKQDSGSKLQEK
jgi:capsular exopolysaccharide synthesis family protein